MHYCSGLQGKGVNGVSPEERVLGGKNKKPDILFLFNSEADICLMGLPPEMSDLMGLAKSSMGCRRDCSCNHLQCMLIIHYLAPI